jgi:hypothetical protein
MVLPLLIPFREKPEELREDHGHTKEPGAFEPDREAGAFLPSKQNAGKLVGHEKTTDYGMLAVDKEEGFD